MLSGTQWKARSHAAYQGYSQQSGIERMWPFCMWNHCRLRTSARLGARNGCAPCSCSHRSRSK